MTAIRRWLLLGLGCSCAALGCDDQPDKPPSATPSAPSRTATPEATVTPKPAGPPDFEIDTLSAKVGFERALLDKNDGRTMLQSLLKRGVYGSWHHVSREHLPKYSNEFAFRWSNNKISDGARMAVAVPLFDGKRLMYRQPAS